jgi:3-phosphoshikimate 1-carboxyvinyltransferase
MNISPLAQALQGVVVLPGDKSVSHRALLFAALARSPSEIRHLGSGGDNKSTIACLRQLGVRIETSGEKASVSPPEAFSTPTAALDCGNSGTTMRLMAGMLAGARLEAELVGDESLSKRPMRRVADPLAKLGARVHTADGGRPPLQIEATPLTAATVDTGVVSAQVKSALVLAALFAEGESRISEPELSRDHTERMMQALGFPLRLDKQSIVVGPLSKKRPEGFSVWVPGDPSSAAFWAVLATLVPGSDVTLIDVCLNPTRTSFLDVLKRMGARIDVKKHGMTAGEPWGDIRIQHAPELQATEVSGHEAHLAIDELPVLMVAMANARGRSSIRGARDLRNKESDRIAAMAAVLRGFSIKHDVVEDGIDIDGVTRDERRIDKAVVEAELDHRIALSAAVMALAGPASVEIRGFEAASVSYGAFLAEAKRLSSRDSVRGYPVTVSIDGPAGAGKSTVSRMLAHRLGYTLVDTGAIYRSLAWKALQRGLDPGDGAALETLAQGVEITFEAAGQNQRVRCDGMDVTEAIRTPEISHLASIVSQHRGVRAALLDIQRRLAGKGGAVLEGRDIGTVVFPEAQAKFFLDAAPEERARRRMDELKAKQQVADYDVVLKEIKERDLRDSERDISPLKPAPDAVLLDSTKLDIDAVVAEMERRVRAKEPKP